MNDGSFLGLFFGQELNRDGIGARMGHHAGAGKGNEKFGFRESFLEHPDDLIGIVAESRMGDADGFHPYLIFLEVGDDLFVAFHDRFCAAAFHIRRQHTIDHLQVGLDVQPACHTSHRFSDPPAFDHIFKVNDGDIKEGALFDFLQALQCFFDRQPRFGAFCSFQDLKGHGARTKFRIDDCHFPVRQVGCLMG